MSVNALILLRLKSDQIGSICFDDVRKEFIQTFNLDKDDFYHEGPFQVIFNRDEGPIPIKDEKSVWVNINLWHSYFGRGYERGDIVFL